MSISSASGRALAEARFSKAILALSRVHSSGGGALADAAGYARPNLTLAQQGLRRLPPHVAARFEELLSFGPEGFRSERVEPGLVRHEDQLQFLLDAGFTIKPLLQILSNAEARALEARCERPLDLAGTVPAGAEMYARPDQQFVAVKLSYAGTHRFFILRGNPTRLRALLANAEGSFPYVRLPAGLHRELADLQTRLDGDTCGPAALAFWQGLYALDRRPREVDLFPLQRALVDWIHQESPKFRPPKSAPAPLEAALRETVCREYTLTPATAQSDEYFGRLRSGIPTRVRVLISTSDDVELSARPAQSSHLIVLHMVEGPAALFELVFEGPAALAIPKGSVAHSSDLDALRTQNALVPAIHRLTRNH